MRRGSAASQTAAFENTQTKGHNEMNEKEIEERTTAALGSVILLISQTMDMVKNRRKHCDERAKLMSDTEEKFCFELIAAINQAGIDYDNAVAKMKAWQEGAGKTIHEVARGAFAAPSRKGVQG